MKTVLADSSGLEEAARVLLSGGVAVIPTDTVYGLAAHPAFPAAVERLYSIKNRSAAKPIAMLAASAGAVTAAGFPLSGRAADLASRHWPGPLTLVLDNSAGSSSEGFRVPDLAWTRALLERCGGLLRVTSANMSGRRPAADAPSALAEVGLDADIVVDGGVSPGGTASTVLRPTASGIEVLRPGPVEL